MPQTSTSTPEHAQPDAAGMPDAAGAPDALAELSPAEQRWAGVLGARIAQSVLPGDAALSGARLGEAAAFMIAAGRHRADGQPAIAIGTRGGARRFMRAAIINKDMPFLVDSIAATLAAHGLPIHTLVHPVLPVRRSGGALEDMPEGEGLGERRESWIYLETERTDARARRLLEEELRTTILDVRAAVADWPFMRERIAADADLLPDSEGAALLRWLGDGMLTQLGHVVIERDGSALDPRGICRRSTPELISPATIVRAFTWFEGAGRSEPVAAPGRAPLIIKANRIARVHRRVPLDLFIVPVHREGRVAALSIHAGLWTSAALALAPDKVPVLRQHLRMIAERLAIAPGGHAHKGLVHALTALPHDLTISFDEGDMLRVACAMMSLADRPRPRAALVSAPLGRHVFAFVWLPRDLLSTDIRKRIEKMLEDHTGASTIDWSLQVEGGALAMLRYVLDTRGQPLAPASAAIDAALLDMTRGWPAAVEQALLARHDHSRAAALALRHAECFPPAYRAAYGAPEAAADIERLRHLETRDDLARDARLYRPARAGDGLLRLKIYQDRGWLPLSDAVPALENFGFRVLAEVPTELAGIAAGTIHDFTLELPAGIEPESVLARAGPIEEVMRQVLHGRADDDLFNRLVLACGLDVREVDLLRAIYRYLRQENIAFTMATVVESLERAPHITTALIGLFRSQHDPAFPQDRQAARAQSVAQINAALVDIASINHDRVLRLYRDIILAMLRTNAYAPAGSQALAFKFDSSLVPGLPRPVPWREIFVYSRQVEGIHLRAGPVARGGLRWSDRRDDFRTEILGLLKAQKVKNAVIVPSGAKGGFYPKQLPDPARDRDAWFAEGRASYQLFIRTLLSITDNVVAGKVVHPPQIVIHDGPDPYFVVAADKGTATFSDTANAIALEAGFWLGDAFASGGSNGYDHKAMGITARGAWLNVDRHFREMGLDIARDPINVVGCGDMSGDVFGNGMLLSRAIRLVAAFDHRHIFLDPAPDPASSWAERKRLFDLPRSSWDDYDRALISAGGGVFARSAKSIAVSDQIRQVLGIDAPTIEPEALIRAILRSPADLVWFGGIGTYVKDAAENNAAVGDPGNDALRVDAQEMRARVIGEGANLGVTQAGRIAFALRGGRINTDFIDNSAGVDCSDNEVNIKIALAAARAAGRIEEGDRNALLRDMTEPVAQLVLENNRLQALALSIAEAGSSNATRAYAHLIETLEEQGGLDRQTEGLPDSEALARRAIEGRGLTRPELAVLLSNAKLALQAAIERGPLAGGQIADEVADALVLADFPAVMQQRFGAELRGHQLRREIIGTLLANRMINRIGMIHPFELAEEEGASLDRIASAYLGVTTLLGMEDLWSAIEQGAMPEQARMRLFQAAARALRGHIGDLLRSCPGLIAPAALVRDLAGAISALQAGVDDLLSQANRQHVAALVARLEDAGAPADLARRVGQLVAMDGALGLARLSAESGVCPIALSQAFCDLGARLGIDWAQAQAATMSPPDPWERLLAAGLARDFQQMRLGLVGRLAAGGISAQTDAQTDARLDPLALVEGWAQENGPAIARFAHMIRRAQAATPLGPAMLAQIASQARVLLQA